MSSTVSHPNKSSDWYARAWVVLGYDVYYRFSLRLEGGWKSLWTCRNTRCFVLIRFWESMKLFVCRATLKAESVLCIFVRGVTVCIILYQDLSCSMAIFKPWQFHGSMTWQFQFDSWGVVPHMEHCIYQASCLLNSVERRGSIVGAPPAPPPIVTAEATFEAEPVPPPVPPPP